jgi:sterol desaturase/sphingolipid hydroxylase (fatty acid hydroxylase superfamily)
LTVLCTIPVGLVYTSFFEWAYHRYWLHRPWLPPQMFTAHTFQWWAGPIIVAIAVIPWALLAWGMSALGVRMHYIAALSTIAGVVFAYYLAYEGFHFLMHKPTLPWIERAGFFQFIKNHHRLHHVYMGKNYNVVLPVADALMGTIVRRDEQPAKATGPEAKRIARRHSNYGRRLAEGSSPEAAPQAAVEDARAREESSAGV